MDAFCCLLCSSFDAEVSLTRAKMQQRRQAGSPGCSRLLEAMGRAEPSSDLPEFTSWPQTKPEAPKNLQGPGGWEATWGSQQALGWAPVSSVTPAHHVKGKIKSSRPCFN